MNNNSILLIDPNFEPANSTNLNLLVKIGADTFSYAIIDLEKNFVHAVYDEQECENGYEKLNERLKNDSYLQLAYKQVTVATHTNNIVFVPQELFNENNIAVYTKYFEETDSPAVYVQPSAQQKFSAVFSLPLFAEKTINEQWKTATRLYLNAGLIELADQLNRDTVLLDFTVGSFQFIYLKNQKVTFTQSYQFEDLEELTYFILLIINQLKINPENTELKACGIIHDGDEKWKLLKQYFKQIDLLTIQSRLDTNILDDMPSHYYTGLLALQQCV